MSKEVDLGRIVQSTNVHCNYLTKKYQFMRKESINLSMDQEEELGRMEMSTESYLICTR
jgi:hypothetical protein